MGRQNLGLCNECRDRVPAEFYFPNDQVWIRKTCPKCGVTESMVSADAKVWRTKREMEPYAPTEPVACTLNCDRCKVDHKPTMVFLDVTNRCNMNCPICIATIRGMGFDFNPPMEYFEKVFQFVGSMRPQPVVQLFGGEPTVRNDLMEIIQIARKHGLKPHVTTNGVRLADEEYCRKMCEARVPVRIAFDGRSPDIYERLRKNRGAYDKKMKALDNLHKYSQRKQTIISTAAKGVNDHLIGDLLQFCHEHRDLISDIGIIPLTENWDKGEFDAAVHTTMEDVEKMVQQGVPGGQVEFIPAGLSQAMRLPRSFFRENPRSEVLLLAGVHPNCESFTLLISDGKTYRSVNHYLKKSFTETALEFVQLSKKVKPKLEKLDPKKFFQRMRGRLTCARTFGPFIFRTVRFRRLAGGSVLLSLLKLAFTKMLGKGGTHGFPSRRPRRILRVAMLPFEEQHSVDAARMESCKAVFAYEDPDDNKMKTIPACLWYPYRNAILEKLSKKYGVVKGAAEKAEPVAAEA